MFDASKMQLPPYQKLAEVLNYTLADLVSHGKLKPGYQFVSRGDDTAYLKVPGEETMGAICVSLQEGDPQAIIYFHPSRTGREAWQLSATPDGCQILASDEDMEEARAWANSKHEPYCKPRKGSCFGLYEVVGECLYFMK